MPSTARAAAHLSLAALLPLLAACRGADRSAAAPEPGDVSGRYILTICDGDMDASSFITQALPERAEGEAAGDALTVITLPLREPQTPWAQADVSNSAWGPPNAVAASRDGKYAYIVEARGQAPTGATRVDQLPLGEVLTTVDLSTPLSPTVIDKRYVGHNPTALGVHPDGDLLAIANSREGNQIVLVALERGVPTGEPMSWPLIGLDDAVARPSCVAWHPSGRGLALTLPDRNEVVFYRFTRDDGEGAMALQAWGAPVKVDAYPSSCVFTPDGRYLVINSLFWGPGIEGFFVGSPNGTVSSIAVGAVDGSDDSADTHRVVSTVPVGVNPEGLAMSPDGSIVVTANLVRSFLPETDNRFTRGGSVSVLEFDRQGQLRVTSEEPVAAMPEGICFDSTGRFVVVTQFRSFDPAATDGELAFFRVINGEAGPALRAADFFVGVGKNPHGVVIVR